jgi:toxin HigB-1
LLGLSGDRDGFHAVTVQANWRLTFRFVGQDVELLDYLDYH